MKWAIVSLALVFSFTGFGQSQTSSIADSTTIHVSVSGLSSSAMCSAELRSADSGFAVQRVPCGPLGFEFSEVPRGRYIVAVQVGLKEVRQQVDADMPNTELDMRAPENKSEGASDSSTMSVKEMLVPSKARGLMEKASNLIHESKFKEAEQKLEQALKIAPQFSRALALKAIICARNRDLAFAMQAADSAVASDAQL